MLRDFYFNEELRNEVHNYLVTFLKERAIEKVFNKEDTKDIAEAKNTIDEAFENLGVLYPQDKRKDSINEAR